MHTKLKLAVLAAFTAVAFSALPANAAYSVYSDPDCGPKVESSAWLIDYSGTMQEKLKEPEEKSYPDWAKGKEKEYDELFEYRKVVLAKNLLLKLRRMLPAEAGIQVAAGTMAPHTLPVGFKDDFEKKVGRLPERLEVFGRMTNPGEGLIDYEKRLERYAESEKELQRETA